MRMHAVRNPEAGMTLLEIMIASGIMAAALVMLMGSVVSISAAGATSEERAMAAAHISSIMEEVAATNLDVLPSYEPPALRGLRSETVTVVYVNVDGDEVELPLPDGVDANDMPNPVEVRVRVAWESKSGHPYERTVSTFHRY